MNAASAYSARASSSAKKRVPATALRDARAYRRPVRGSMPFTDREHTAGFRRFSPHARPAWVSLSYGGRGLNRQLTGYCRWHDGVVTGRHAIGIVSIAVGLAAT